MRGSFDAFRNPQDSQRQFKQESHHKNTHEQGHNSRDQINQALGRGLLHAEHDAGDHRNPAAKKQNDVKQLHEAAKERTAKGEIEKTRKKILFIGHVASWAHKSIVQAGREQT
jgi:hypothetical protein